MRRSIKRNERPQAWLGLASAILSTIGTIASTAINANSAKKQQEFQKNTNDYNNSIASAEAMTENFANQNDIQQQYEQQSNMSFKCGGRRNLKNGGFLYGGSNKVRVEFPNAMLQIAPGLFYDMSRTHEEGGNDVDNKNGKALFEEEAGEILDLTKKGQARVFSAQPISSNGDSPVNNVLNGMNPDIVFADQEANKRPTLRCGGRHKALGGWSSYIGDSNMTYGDAYNAGISTFGNIGSGLINYFTYKNMEAPAAPVLTPVGSLLTRYNINPELQELSNARQNTTDYIARNVSSSAAAREATANTNLNYALQSDKLWGDKTNKEVEMINKNIAYQDEARRANNKLISDYRSQLVDFNNQRRTGMAGAITSGITGLMNTANAIAQNIDTRDINKMNAGASLMQGNPQSIAYWAVHDPETFKRLYGQKAYDTWSQYIDPTIANENDSYAKKRCGGRRSLKR